MSKILIIDDEESIRLMLTLSLENKGYKVFVAEDGEQGVDIFENERPPIVITDIKMPGMTGIEVLKKIRHIDPDTRVIVITGHGEMESAVEALQLEASDFVSKPLTDAALSVALRRAEQVLALKSKLRGYTHNLEETIKEATGELRAAHDFQKNLIESSIDGIVAADKGGVIVVFNQGAETLLGYTAEEVIRKKTLDNIYTKSVAVAMQSALDSEEQGGRGRLVHYESTARSKGGEDIPVRISGATLFDKGETSGLVFFLQDLREIKRLERELIENERLAAMGQAVAGMAHYIKNILNGLEGGVYMVSVGLEKDKPERLTKGWAMVQNNIRKISDLVMNMLIYSKEREPEYEECFPNHIVDEVFELMQERAGQAGVTLQKDLDFSVDSCLLDPGGVHRCLLNLVANAIDACKGECDNGETATVCVKTRKEKDGVHFDVEDNGPGMTAEVQEKLFDRFFSTKGAKGTGLGLLVTRKIVDEAGGFIHFTSEVGRGTHFSLCFPRGAPAGGEADGPSKTD